MRKLGVIAGSGPVPGRVAEARLRAGGEVFVVALDGIADPETVRGLPHARVGIGRLQTTIDRLLEAGAEDVVLAGPVRRPALSALDLDARAARALVRGGRKAFGDDGLLSLVVAELERDGLRVVGIDEVLGGVLAPAGRIAGPEPDAAAEADIARGLEVLRRLGPADVGQAAAVQEGLVLAVEAVEGTDAMIARAGALKRPGPGPVLVKAGKPGQERRVDLPTVGPETVRAAIVAGFRGLAVEAGGTLLIDGGEARRLAEAAGFFAVGANAAADP